MSVSNPFQIPSCLQASLQQQRRERFKKTVLLGVGATVALLTGLLILGCKSEHAKAASTQSATLEAPAETPAPVMTAPVAEPKHISLPVAPTSHPVVAPVSAPIVSKEGANVPAVRTASVYVVKPADTLTRIAKTHGTTVSALKAANGLDTDRIAVGMKLKLPEV